MDVALWCWSIWMDSIGLDDWVAANNDICDDDYDDDDDYDIIIKSLNH